MFWTIIIAIVAFFIFIAIANQKKRKAWTENYFRFLKDKFGEERQIRIVRYQPWLGQTYEEFMAMYGRPNYVEKVEMKTKTKLILSYGTFNGNTKRSTNNKYTFENDLLTKQEIKGPINKVWEVSKQRNPFM